VVAGHRWRLSCEAFRRPSLPHRRFVFRIPDRWRSVDRRLVHQQWSAGGSGQRPRVVALLGHLPVYPKLEVPNCRVEYHSRPKPPSVTSIRLSILNPPGPACRQPSRLTPLKSWIDLALRHRPLISFLQSGKQSLPISFKLFRSGRIEVSS
jgi:hypothetical protein